MRVKIPQVHRILTIVLLVYLLADGAGGTNEPLDLNTPAAGPRGPGSATVRFEPKVMTNLGITHLDANKGAIGRRSDRRARTSLTGEFPPRLAGTAAHSTSTAGRLVRVVVAFALTYVLGYERELRGSPAGDRTFSLIGTASAVPSHPYRPACPPPMQSWHKALSGRNWPRSWKPGAGGGKGWRGGPD